MMEALVQSSTAHSRVVGGHVEEQWNGMYERTDDSAIPGRQHGTPGTVVPGVPSLFHIRSVGRC